MDSEETTSALDNTAMPQQDLQRQHEETATMSRRSSVASTNSSICGNGHMSEFEQEERRRQIKTIMQDTTLTQQEKSRQIQALMDGRQQRRRNSEASSVFSDAASQAAHSYVNSVRRAAAMAAAMANEEENHTDGHDEDEEEEDTIMSDAAAANAPEIPSMFHHYRNGNDDRSVASSVTSHTGNYSDGDSESSAEPIPPGTTYRQIHGRSYSLQEWSDPASRQQAAANTTFVSHDNLSRLMETSRPVCDHYDRNCTMIAPCCGLAFGCRICHDECPVLPPPLEWHLNKVERRRSMPTQADEINDSDDNHHLIDRFAVKEVICRKCYLRQNSKTNKCVRCDVRFGEYHCNICNLWMSNKEMPYHCSACGFCRVGGRDNFRHCVDCGMCIDALLFDDHNCKSGKYMSNCPVCQEDLFSSRFASHEMPCGHAIHWHCFKELTSYDTRCPVCKKTAESPEQMAATWSAIAMGIALQPVPPEMARVVNIFCNDCECSDINRRWHFLGVRCLHCFSFNTNVEQIVMQGRDAAAYLDDVDENGIVVDGAGGVPTNISMPSAVLAGLTTSSLENRDSSSEQTMDEDSPSAQGTSAASSDR